MVEKRLKILHLLLSLETGGMERFVYEHCLALNHDEFDVSVCCIDRLEGFSQSLREHGIKVDLLQKNQQHFDWFFPFRLKGGGDLAHNARQVVVDRYSLKKPATVFGIYRLLGAVACRQ